MARMIPAFMDDRTPPGERDVYNMLATGPNDWTAIHSLDLAPWNKSLRTEIDFILIVPDTGIVCIEVKSHENISFENDRWLPADIKRSPFKQASDGRHTFYRRLREIAPHLCKIPIVHLCIFPRAAFDLPTNLSVQPCELIDGRCFRMFPCGQAMCNDIKVRMQQSIIADVRLQPMLSSLSPDRVESIIDYCLPVRKHRPDIREEILQREADAERILRNQQKPVLQLAALNDRLIVSGGAGTGKTLIAMEVARRAAGQGKRVAILCFNQLVGDWLNRRMEHDVSMLPNLIVGRAIRVMMEMSGLPFPDQPTKDYWEHELPTSLEERLTDPDFRAVASFDYLVVDEAQDLLSRPRLWQCLSQFLNGGVEKGKFTLFGDFDNQVLADRHVMEETLSTLKLQATPANWVLTENCRNYQIIGDTALLLSGFNKNVYLGYLRSGGSVQNYDIFFYEDDKDQLEGLGRFLKDFRAKGYKPTEISILSFCSDDSCSAARLRSAGYKLLPSRQAREYTGYSSIQAFKGMENKIVILTDLELGKMEFHRHLFYTGMTRATESVRILCSKKSMPTLIAWLSGKEN